MCECLGCVSFYFYLFLWLVPNMTRPLHSTQPKWAVRQWESLKRLGHCKAWEADTKDGQEAVTAAP